MFVVGHGSGSALASDHNVIVGNFCAPNLTGAGGQNNTIVGYQAGNGITSGQQNVLVGTQAMNNSSSGSGNICVGYQAGNGLTAGDSNNILIFASGNSGDNNITRIGYAFGATSQTACYIDGIQGVTTGQNNVVTIDTTTGQLGSTTLPFFFTWSVITANQTAVVNNGYICNKAGTLALALPAASSVGDIIEVTGINTATGWQITQAAGQQIFFGTTQTTLGATGTLTSSAIRDALRMVCITANTTWQVLSSIGNITVV